MAVAFGVRVVAEERGWFDRPVSIAGQRPGSMVVVSNAQQAADILLNRWPKTTGNTHIAARRAVLKALENHADARARAKARDAFAEAAEDAGLLRE